jgi:hypothetical protein
VPSPQFERQERKGKRALVSVGLISVAFGLLGLCGNLWLSPPWKVLSALPELARETGISYLAPTYLTMFAISVACHSILVFCGIYFVFLRLRVMKLFIGVFVFEILYLLAMGATPFLPVISTSIAATVVASSGGLLLQLCFAFPLWAPFLAWWAGSWVPKPESHLSTEADCQADASSILPPTPR